VKIGFGQSLPKKACSRSSPSLAHWFALKVVGSLRRVCGGLRLLLEWLFVHGRRPYARSLLWIISRRGMLLWWIDDACAKEMGSQWITFFLLCGMLSLLALVCLGLCLGVSSTCLLVGGHLGGRRVLRFGRWCQLAFLVCLKGNK
jgi:hypothetical protein